MADTEDNPRPRGKGLASLYALFIFASAALFQKYLGLAGVMAYAVLVAAAGFAWWQFNAPIQRWLDRRFGIWAAVFFIGLAGVFAIGYPIEDSQGRGRSSDRDDGLNIAVERMLDGKTPYYPPNQDAGPLSLFPGAILLATPFVILGNSAYQNFFWIGVFIWLTNRIHRRRSEVLLLAGVAFALCPALQYEFISGGDMLSNGIYVAVALVLFLRFWTHPCDGSGRRIAAAVFLGLALASRPNFLLLLPLAGCTVWRSGGFPKAVAGCALVVATVVVVTLPIQMADPAGFTPLAAGNKLALIDHHFPWGSRVLHGISALMAVFAGLYVRLGRKQCALSAILGLAAWVTATPMIGAVILYSIIHRGPDFGFMHPRYGLMYLFLALWAWGLQRGLDRDCTWLPAATAGIRKTA